MKAASQEHFYSQVFACDCDDAFALDVCCLIFVYLIGRPEALVRLVSLALNNTPSHIMARFLDGSCFDLLLR